MSSDSNVDKNKRDDIPDRVYQRMIDVAERFERERAERAETRRTPADPDAQQLNERDVKVPNGQKLDKGTH